MFDDSRMHCEGELSEAVDVKKMNHFAFARRTTKAWDVVTKAYCLEPLRRAIGAGERRVLTL